MTTSQPFASFAAQFDQADEPVGGKWTDRFNQVRSGVETLHKGLQLLNKINDERKKAGFDVDSSAAVDSSFDFGSAQSGTDHPTFELTHHALNAGQETDAGDEDVGGKFKVIQKAIQYAPLISTKEANRFTNGANKLMFGMNNRNQPTGSKPMLLGRLIALPLIP